MNQRRCPRLWEVEAARDGRLDEVALASHRSHLARCLPCQDEHAALAMYFDAMSELGSDVDRFKLRRLRQSVIADLESHASTRGPRERRWPYVRVLACAVALVALTVTSGIGRRPRAPEADAIAIVPGWGAQWQRTQRKDEDRVVLTRGTLSFRVHRRPGTPRLVVVVPEGEIEDTGTIFQVSVEDGRTTQIEVREGSVVFRRRAMNEQTVLAGSRWSPPTAHPPAGAAHSQTGSAQLPATAVQQAPALDAEKPKPVRGRKLSAALTEDQAYLRVIRSVRNGERSAAKAAAGTYLQAFPTGFRLPEVTRLLEQLAEADAGAPR